MTHDPNDSLKHNARLDIRLPDQMKDDFLSRCREDGVSSGAVMRSLILEYLARERTLPRMATGFVERIMKRGKFWLGLASGGLITGLTAASVLLAPAASADEVVLNYFIQLTELESEGNSIWQGDFNTQLDGVVTILPLERKGQNPYGIEVQARPCDEMAAVNCDVEFEIGLYNFDLIDEGQEGQLATRVMTTRFGSGASFSVELEDGRTLSGHSVPTFVTSAR